MTNPLSEDESVLRRSLLPGLLKAIAFNVDRRQEHVGLFEVGHVFPLPDPERVRRALAHDGTTVVDEHERFGWAVADGRADAAGAVTAWLVIEEALGLEGLALVAPSAANGDGARPAAGPGVPPGLHPTRSAWLVPPGRDEPVGALGEVDPDVVAAFGLHGRVAWIEVDTDALDHAPRRPGAVRAVSPFPSSDIDLAFAVPDEVPAAALVRTLRESAGDLLERVTLFDVYRGPGVPTGSRSLAFGLRLCAQDHTLSGSEIAEVRDRCIAAVERVHRARLRG